VSAVWAVVYLACLASSRASAQEPVAIDWLSLIGHDPNRPAYFAGLEPLSPPAISLPPPPLGQPPAVVRALYGNGWVFGSARFYDLVRLADSTEINALVLDIKDDTGFLTYRSAVPTAIEIGANSRLRVGDVRERLAVLSERGIHPIARIVVAKDPLLARMKPQWAIHDARGGLWHDRQGNAWVDAYQDSVWSYAADLAAEAVLMGFGEVQFDYVRFPDEPLSLLSRAVYLAKPGDESERQSIKRHLALMRSRIKPLGVPFTIDVFGLTTSATSDMGIGQFWEDLVEEADVVLPMVYPSHYQHGAYGFPRPNFEPYSVVKRALEFAIRRSAAVHGSAKIRPYLQSFTLGRPRYTAEEVRAQIRAAEDLGIDEWVLWNARGVYPAAALRSTSGQFSTGDGPSTEGAGSATP